MRFDDGIPEITEQELVERERSKLGVIAAAIGGEVPDIQVRQTEGEHMGRRVKCINTGEEFDSCNEAERSKGFGVNTLNAAIKRSGQYRGETWEFIDPPASNGDVESNPSGVSDKVRKMARVPRIRLQRRAVDPPAALTVPTPQPSPATVVTDPAPERGKLRVLYVECDGGALSSVIEQIASIVRK